MPTDPAGPGAPVAPIGPGGPGGPGRVGSSSTATENTDGKNVWSNLTMLPMSGKLGDGGLVAFVWLIFAK